LVLNMPSTAKPLNVLLSGYYGFDNYGDELICQSLCQLLRANGAQVTVLSNHPQATRAQHKVGAIHRYNGLQLLVNLFRAKVFISGGGGLFQDATGTNSPLFYGLQLVLARLFGKTVVHAYQSVGPLTTGFGQWLTALALKQCHFIMVRDETSASVVEQLIGERPLVTADAVWALLPTMVERPSNPLFEPDGQFFRLGLSLRPCGGFDAEQQKALVQVLSQFSGQLGKPLELVLLPCQTTMDVAVLEAVAQQVQEAVNLQARGQVKVIQAPVAHLSKAIAGCHAVLGMRYHSLVSAILHQVPVFALDYDPKVQALATQLGLPVKAVSQLSTLRVEQLFEALLTYRQPDVDALKNQVLLGMKALVALTF
jgi:polysaccharide pyruvyl transferase CsaB